MTADATLDWTMELVRRHTAHGGRFDLRILSARHRPTGNEILLVLDKHGCVERTEMDEACPRELLEEIVALFPACLRSDDV